MADCCGVGSEFKTGNTATAEFSWVVFALTNSKNRIAVVWHTFGWKWVGTRVARLTRGIPGSIMVG